MDKRIGTGVLALSAAGYPTTQYTIRRFGRPGAVLVQAVCLGLLARDATLIARGAPRVLRRGPAVLLRLECAAAALAAVSNARLLVDERAPGRVGQRVPDLSERIRRTAVGALFGLHTLRLHIYLQPDQGRRRGTTGAATRTDLDECER